MSAIEVLKKDITKLDDIVSIYKEYLSDADEIIKLSGRRIDVANAEQSGWSNYYHDKEVEVKHLRDFMQVRLNEVHGRLWTKYTEKMDRVLVQKDKEEYIRHDPIYLEVLEQFLKVNELYEQFERITESFKTRGYALNNLTRLVVASNNDWIIP